MLFYFLGELRLVPLALIHVPVSLCRLFSPQDHALRLSASFFLQIGVHALEAVTADAIALGDIPQAFARLAEIHQDARFGFLGGLLLGIIEAMAQAYISTNLANSIVFAVLIVVLLVKPAGLLGKSVMEKV